MAYSYRFSSSVRISHAAGHDTCLCSMATTRRWINSTFFWLVNFTASILGQTRARSS
jgi:hypothetical protein